MALQCTETTSSPAMELEGLIRCRNEVEEAGLTINSITTDQHISIRAHIRDCWPEVTHYFDAWHIAKGSVYYEWCYSLYIIIVCKLNFICFRIT